jgi:hypothetical protein
MIGIALRRRLSRSIACFAARRWKQGEVSHGLLDKSAAVGRAHVVGRFEVSRSRDVSSAGASDESANEINASTAVAFREASALPS